MPSAAPFRSDAKSSHRIWPARLLLVAAAWNIVGGASALLDPAKHFAQLFHGSLPLGDPLPLFFYQCVWINVIAWGVGYLLAAVRPLARGPVLVAGAAGKSAYFAASVAAYAGGAGQPALIAAGAVDLLFAGLFVVILVGSGRAAEVAR